jgi:Asp-tRNA(Asn)/Glu-tRNA(Gln) amidotransferase A subunit family amidase
LIWGTAENFYDRERSCGGSSGGDAGLVASRCVPIAIGSDIGGSIRVPATFNGIIGFKPT